MQTTNETEVAPEAQPNINPAFLTLLQRHRSGLVLDDLAVAMRAVTEAVKLVGKAGSLTVKFNIKPSGSSEALLISDEIKVAVPRIKTRESLFYTDENGNLHRNDPRQHELPLRSIQGGVVDVTSLKKVEGA